MIESKKKRCLMTLSTNVLLSTLFSVIVLVVVVTVIAALPISIFLLPPLPFSYAQQQQKNAATDSALSCITYDSNHKIITITCGSARLTDIDNQIKDAKVIHKEGQGKTAEPANGSDHRGIWLLNAGNGIDVHGRLKIDSVKITSWDLQTNDYAKTDVQGKIPRPYIFVDKDATGTTDITNSELAYLGYEGDYRSPGLRYNGGSGSLVKGNHIHHLQTGFYSDGVGDMIIEGNLVHDNTVYGLDPHTGTHDMIIRNNIVYNNGEEGLICSLDCYNITIEGNEVYSNADAGIMFSRNMYNSVARNNYVHNEVKGIFVSASNNNEVYNNTVSNSGEGIYVKAEAANNKIYGNTITNATSNGILVNTGAFDNTFSSNTIVNAAKFGINVAADSNNNVFENNKLINSKVAGQEE